MESRKCPECGLVSWVEEGTVSCQRCGGPLWGKRSYGLRDPAEVANAESVFSGMIKFVTILLGVAVLVLMAVRVFSLSGTGAGKAIAVLFIVVGIGLIISMKIWFLIEVFSQSVGWGLASLFLPFGALIALIKFWERTRRPFFAHLLSTGIIVVGFMSLV